MQTISDGSWHASPLLVFSILIGMFFLYGIGLFVGRYFEWRHKKNMQAFKKWLGKITPRGYCPKCGERIVILHGHRWEDE